MEPTLAGHDHNGDLRGLCRVHRRAKARAIVAKNLAAFRVQEFDVLAQGAAQARQRRDVRSEMWTWRVGAAGVRRQRLPLAQNAVRRLVVRLKVN